MLPVERVKRKFFPMEARSLNLRKKNSNTGIDLLVFNPFIGEENVWQNEKIVWGMNYYGRIISKTIPVKQIYQFLQEALKKLQKINH